MTEERAPRPLLQNPLSGTTIATTSEDLELDQPREQESSTKNLLQRGVEKLSRSTSIGKTKSGKERRKRFSVKRNPDKEDLEEMHEEMHEDDTEREGDSHAVVRAPSQNRLPPNRSVAAPPASTTTDLRQPISLASATGATHHTAPEDIKPVRPSLMSIRGDGSMRAGTQTLIQALQAIPWAEDDAVDDFPAVSQDVDHNQRDDTAFSLSSSIHTIHRPVARMRRMQSSMHGIPTVSSLPSLPHQSEEEDTEGMEQGESSEDGDDTEDSDGSGNGNASPRAAGENKEALPADSSITRPHLSARTASLATVKLQRRRRLAEKLRDVFALAEIEDVLAEMPCWLLRSVLLQGYMYLTNGHLCFFAHLPTHEDQVLKSGILSKRASRTKRWNKFWFVLKNDVLSWYQSSADPYFPHGNLDLRYAVSCEPSGERGLRLRTNLKNINLMADSAPSRDEWVKVIRKVMFKAQNMGESVKIAIPYHLIIDVDKNNSMDFTETIEVKVVDKDENYSIDSYFFAYFRDLNRSLEQIQRVLRSHRQSHGSALHDGVQDTTSSGVISSIGMHDRGESSAPSDTKPSAFRLSSLLRPFSGGGAHGNSRSNSAPAPTLLPDAEDFTHVPSYITASPVGDEHLRSRLSADNASVLSAEVVSSPRSTSESLRTITPSMSQFETPHTYPPSWSNPASSQQQPQDPQSKGWTVPNWIRSPSKLLPNISVSVSHGQTERQLSVSDHASDDDDDREVSNNMGFSLLDGTDVPHVPDNDVAEKFRSTFALDDKEVLLGYLPGSLFRVLPVFGRVYISTSFFCFRSSQPLIKTRMIIPMRDIIAVEKQRAFRFGYHGLIVVIKGHEELFFEFGSPEKRDACVKLLEAQMESARQQHASPDMIRSTKGQTEASILEDLEPSTPALEPDPIPVLESAADALPAVMFTSSSSTFLTFKPQEPLRFTFLTIGSRGDVQPYIALGKGLIADGHHVKIATHGEYKGWVEGHGIEHAYVGGDPAELMRICVENGMFTYSFLKEGVQKFRGWIDDLLKTAWEACQNSDVLIESPSAMAGIHIAEALGIPYFRAFTMPWTRTRAYPHAFAVPERKMGGSYNYMTYVMFDQVFWRATSGQINRWRRNVLGLTATNLDKLEPHKVPFLYNFSPTVVPPPLDWYEWIRVTGYWFLDDPDNSQAQKWSPPDDLVQFIDSSHAANLKVVYIGFGSIVVSDPDAMTQCVVQAIQLSGVRAILSKGWSDRLSTKKDAQQSDDDVRFPSNIYPISSIPHDWLFPRIDAACHHGGAGTTGASLRAGIPTIIKPFFGDQFFWSDRVEALGIGSSVRKLTVENLTEALRAATTDERQISRARLVGQKIRSENGVANAVEAIYRDLEYARTLIKRNSTDEENEVVNTLPQSDVRHLNEARDSSVDSSSGSFRGTSEDWEAVSYTSG